MVHDIFGQTFFRKHSRYTRWQCCKYTVEVRICSLLFSFILWVASVSAPTTFVPAASSATSLEPCLCTCCQATTACAPRLRCHASVKKVDFISSSWKYEFTMENCETRPVHIIGSCLILFHLDHATCQDSLICGSSETACNSTRNSCHTSTPCINGIGGS